MFGKEHYEPLFDWIKNTLLKNNLISKEDIDLIQLTDDISEVERIFKNYFKNSSFDFNF